METLDYPRHQLDHPKYESQPPASTNTSNIFRRMRILGWSNTVDYRRLNEILSTLDRQKRVV